MPYTLDPSERTRAHREYRLLVGSNLIVVIGVLLVAVQYMLLDSAAPTHLAHLTRGGPLWTLILGGSLCVGWVDVLLGPTLNLRRELRDPRGPSSPFMPGPSSPPVS